MAVGLDPFAGSEVEGVSLEAVLARDGPLEPARTLALFTQVAEALDAARWSRGLVHGRLEPACVIVRFDADGHERADLTGFGPGAPAASVDYLAPEQLEHGLVNARTDVYSLGCILYECLTGTAPYRRRSRTLTLAGHLYGRPGPLRDRRAGLPAGLDAVFAKALAKSFEDRHSTCGELVAAARAVLEVAPCR